MLFLSFFFFLTDAALPPSPTEQHSLKQMKRNYAISRQELLQLISVLELSL